MKRILLNTIKRNSPDYKKYYALVDDEDYGRVSQYNWHVWESKQGTLYAITNIKVKLRYKSLKMHKFLTGFKQTDHINGDGLDNRLENLRLLCPNCHSQTETFCGRKNRKNRKKQKIYLCPDCSVIYGGKGKRCRRCANKNIPHRPKIIWPSKDELEKLAMEKPMVKIAQELGIGGTCLRKKI